MGEGLLVLAKPTHEIERCHLRSEELMTGENGRKPDQECLRCPAYQLPAKITLSSTNRIRKGMTDAYQVYKYHPQPNTQLLLTLSILQQCLPAAASETNNGYRIIPPARMTTTDIVNIKTHHNNTLLLA